MTSSLLKFRFASFVIILTASVAAATPIQAIRPTTHDNAANQISSFVARTNSNGAAVTPILPPQNGNVTTPIWPVPVPPTNGSVAVATPIWPVPVPPTNGSVTTPIWPVPVPPTNGSIAVATPIWPVPVPPTNGSFAVATPIWPVPVPPTNGSVTAA